MPFEKGNKIGVGNRGNTRGRPVTQALISALNVEVKKLDDEEKDLVKRGQIATRLGRIARKLVKLAEEGDIQAIKEIFDRVEGKPVQAVVTAEAGSEAAEAMLAVPENLKDLPQTELVRLFQEVAAKGLGKAREQRANDDEREKSAVA